MVEPTMIEIMNAEEELGVFVRSLRARIGDFETITLLRELADILEDDAE